jgi:hypothetical protein
MLVSWLNAGRYYPHRHSPARYKPADHAVIRETTTGLATLEHMPSGHRHGPGTDTTKHARLFATGGLENEAW